jgi:conjugative transfer signal peptidase TraF
MRKKLSRKTLLLALCASLVCFYAGMQIPKRFSITVSDSLRYSLFFLTSINKDTQIRKGSYVLFTLADRPLVQKALAESWKNEPESARFLKNRQLYFIKQVVCTEGDRFRNYGLDFYCNSDHLGQAKTMSLNHSPLQHLAFNGKVPQGCLAVFGHSLDSFDSRYFGFITHKEVRSIAWPIW